MLAVAAVMVLVGTVSKSWIASPESADVHMGPRGMEACMDSVCVDVPTRGLDTDIEVMMTIAMLSGFASAAAAGVFGGMALARRTDRVVVPPRLANACFALAAVSMTVFLIRMVGEKGEVSWAGFVAIGGVVVAAAGLVMLRPHLVAGATHAHQQAQPMQPMQQYGSQPYQQPQMAPPYTPPPQQQAAPSCPRCGTQLHFVAEYQRWFCPHEQQYV